MTYFLLLVLLFNLVILSRGHDQQTLVIGGENANVGEFPFLVGFWVTLDDTTNFMACQGVLIREDLVLTAAHCLWPIYNNDIELSSLEIVAGDHDLNSNYNDKIRSKVSDFYLHPDWMVTNITEPHPSDIGIARLAQNFTLSDSIQTISLPKLTSNEKVGVVAGWGTMTSTNIDPSPILQKVQITVKDERLCAAEYEIYPWAKYNKSAQFCAGNHQKRLCYGDSGAPFLLGREQILYGISSFWNVVCGLESNNAAASFFTRVVPYVTWIESVMNSDEDNDVLTTTTTAGGNAMPQTGILLLLSICTGMVYALKLI